MLRPFALVLALSLVAGCINGDPIPPTPARPSASATAPPPGAPSSESLSAQANASAPPTPSGASRDAKNATVPPGPLVDVPYRWDSKLPAQACRPDPVSSGCAAALPAEGGSDAPALKGNVTRAALELTWTTAA